MSQALTIPPELRVLLGRPLRDAAASAMLGAIGKPKIETIGDRVYMQIGRGEISLHGALADNRVTGVFLYGPGQGSRRNKGYPNDLPGGFTWSATRADVRTALGPPDDEAPEGRGLGDRYQTGSLWVSYDYAGPGKPITRVGIYFWNVA